MRMHASATHPSFALPDPRAGRQLAGETLRYVSRQSPAVWHRHDQLDFKKKVVASLLGAYVSAEHQVETSALAPLEEPPERVRELARAVVQKDPGLGALAMREATSAEESASWHRKPKTGAAGHTKGSSVKKGSSVLPAPTAAHRALYMALGGEAVGEAHVSLSTSGVARCMRELAAAVASVGCVPPPGPMPMPLLELVGCAQREEAEASAAQSEAARSEQLKPPATQPSKKAKRRAGRAAEPAAADAEDKLLEAAIDESVRKRAALEARHAVVEAHQPRPKWEASDDDAEDAPSMGGGWQVFVMHPTSGKSTLVPVAGGETTVKELAAAFAQKTRLPAASLRLQLCKGPSLECTATLREVGLANGGTVHALFALLGGMHQERKLSGGAGTSGVEAATAPPNRPYSLSMSSAGSSGSNVLKCNYKDKQAGEAAAIEAVAAALGDGHPRVMHKSYGYCLLTFETSAAAAAAQVTLSRSAFFSTVNFKQDASASGEPQAMTFQHTSARPTPTSTKFRRQSDEAGGPAARPGEADPLLWHCAEMPTPLIAECATVLGWDVLADAIAKAIEPEPFFTLGGQAAIRNYLKHYFIRVAEEKKALALVSWPKGNAVPAVDAPPLSARTDEDVHAVLFNTGLRSAEYFSELYVLLYREVGRHDGRKWSASSTVLTPCMATASASRKPKSLPALLVSAFGVRPEGYPGVRSGQLVQTANFLCCDSVPPQIQQFDCRVPINHDAASIEHMLEDGPARLERLPTDYRGKDRGELVTRVTNGLQVSGRMACASPRLGVPHFYRPKGVECTHAGAVQLLLPVCLGLDKSKWKPDVTIALKYNGRENCYEAVTLLSLAMARQNARLVQRMDQAWLFDTKELEKAAAPSNSPSSPPPPPPAPQAPLAPHAATFLEEVVSSYQAKLQAMNVKELKAEGTKRNVDLSGCLEKSDLVAHLSAAAYAAA